MNFVVVVVLFLFIFFWGGGGGAGSNSIYMRKPRKFCQRGSNLDNIFLVFFSLLGRIKMSIKAGHHRPTSKTPFKWRFADVPIIAQHRILGL